MSDLFIPQLWAIEAGKRMAAAIDADILSALGRVRWSDRVPWDEDKIPADFYTCQACIFGDAVGPAPTVSVNPYFYPAGLSRKYRMRTP